MDANDNLQVVPGSVAAKMFARADIRGDERGEDLGFRAGEFVEFAEQIDDGFSDRRVLSDLLIDLYGYYCFFF